MKIRGSIMVLVSLLLMLGLSGCGNGEDYESMYNDMASQYNSLANEYNGLLEKNRELSSRVDELTSDIPKVKEFSFNGEDKITLVSSEGKLKFSSGIVSSSFTKWPSVISIGLYNSDILLKSATGWGFTFSNNNEIEMYNEAMNAYGKIQVFKTNDLDIDLNVLVESFFNNDANVPSSSNLSYSKIFYNGNVSGVEGSCYTFIDEKPAVLKAGMFKVGEVVVSYMFGYYTKENVDDSVIDSNIRSLLNSIEVLGTDINIG